MKIPKKLEDILRLNQTLHSIVLEAITSLKGILKENNLYFFEEYTDHGIAHIESVLESCEFLITDDSFENLTPQEVSTLILAVLLHDLGMHTEFSTFKAMIKGEYDSAIARIDTKTWKELWNEYLSEVKRFSSIQRKNIFGDENTPFQTPNLSNKDKLNGVDKKMIGEFLRRHHGRFAYEIALLGLIGEKETIKFSNEKLNENNRKLIGLVARSHSMNWMCNLNSVRAFNPSGHAPKAVCL